MYYKLDIVNKLEELESFCEDDLDIRKNLVVEIKKIKEENKKLKKENIELSYLITELMRKGG